MFKVEDILARLQNGEDAGDIAEEMIKVVNTANEQYQKEEEEKAKAKAADIKNAQKMNDLQTIIDLAYEFCLEYYCDNDEDAKLINDAFANLDAETVNEILNEVGAYAVKMSEIEKLFGNMFGGLFETPIRKNPALTKTAPKTRAADAVIDDFLKSLGLK